jgi:hypothetical protein
MAALTVGKSGAELGGKDGAAARKEIDALWAAVKKLLAVKDAS